MSLREFCRIHGIDATHVSKMERGVFAAPAGHRLDRCIEALGIEKNSNEWFEMYDLAAIERGVLPKYIVDDDSLLSRMLLFFLLFRKFKECENKDDFLIEFKRVIKGELK